MVVIIGAGISGITVARSLTKPLVVLEKENQAGGLATNYSSGPYRFDYGGHYFHFHQKAAIKHYLDRVSRFNEYRRRSRVFLNQRIIPYPLQLHLSFLPAKNRKKIFNEMMSSPRNKGYNLEEHIISHFGEELHGLFFKPFLTKYYQFDLSKIATGMDKGSIPVPDKESVAAGYRGQKFSGIGYNPLFYYPRHSLGNFFNNYVEPVKSRVKLAEEVIEVDIERKKVSTPTQSYNYDVLVNTMPLKHFIRIARPQGAFPDYRKFNHISTLATNIVLQKKRRRFHWIYLPEKEIPFYRAGYYPARSQPVCYLEKTVAPGFSLSKTKLMEEVCFTLEKLGIIHLKSEILYLDSKVIPVSYIIFDRHWRDLVPPVIRDLESRDVYSCGRYGCWNYSSMSDDVADALNIARRINRLQ